MPLSGNDTSRDEAIVVSNILIRLRFKEGTFPKSTGDEVMEFEVYKKLKKSTLTVPAITATGTFGYFSTAAFTMISIPLVEGSHGSMLVIVPAKDKGVVDLEVRKLIRKNSYNSIVTQTSPLRVTPLG